MREATIKAAAVSLAREVNLVSQIASCRPTDKMDSIYGYLKFLFLVTVPTFILLSASIKLIRTRRFYSKLVGKYLVTLHLLLLT